jgi:hypothetical protein
MTKDQVIAIMAASLLRRNSELHPARAEELAIKDAVQLYDRVMALNGNYSL